MKNLMNLKEDFLVRFELKEQSEVLQACCVELLILCLQELRKEESNKEVMNKDLKIRADERIRDSKVFYSDNMVYKVTDIAGYWSNDLEDLVSDELEKLKEQGKYAPADESSDLSVCKRSIFDKIYAWLKSDYDLCFVF